MGRQLLTLALALVAAAALWLGLWPVAAVALLGLAFTFPHGGAATAVGVVVFLGLTCRADPLWVAALMGASWIAGTPDPRMLLVLLLASIAAIFVYVDWTILAGLLALIATLRAVFALRRAVIPVGG